MTNVKGKKEVTEKGTKRGEDSSFYYVDGQLPPQELGDGCKVLKYKGPVDVAPHGVDRITPARVDFRAAESHRHFSTDALLFRVKNENIIVTVRCGDDVFRQCDGTYSSNDLLAHPTDSQHHDHSATTRHNLTDSPTTACPQISLIRHATQKLSSTRTMLRAFAASADASDHRCHGGGCWRPLCSHWRRGAARAAKWAAIWSVLAALEWQAEKLVWIQSIETVRICRTQRCRICAIRSRSRRRV